MRFRRGLLGCWCACAALADVTAIFELDIRPGKMVPQAAVDDFRNGPVKYPQEIRYLVKGERFLSSYGSIEAIGKLSSDEMVLIDRANRRYAETTFPEWVKAGEWQMGNIPEETSEQLSKLKATSSSSATKRTRVIQAMAATEMAGVLSIEMPAPAETPAKVEVRLSVWSANARVVAAGGPHVQELAGAMERITANYSFARMMSGVVGGMPGVADPMKGMIDALPRRGTLMLELTFGLHMPGVADLARAAGRPAGEVQMLMGPMMEAGFVLKRISAVPIGESTFRVPEGFAKVDAAEILRAMVGQVQKNP